MNLFPKRNKKSIENNFLDTQIAEYLLKQMEHIINYEQSQGRIVTFEGYRQTIHENQIHINPMIISQNQEQASALEKGVIDGILHTITNDWKVNIYGNIIRDKILFTETCSIVPIRIFSTDENILQLNTLLVDIKNNGNLKPIYDLELTDDLFKGNYYDPPRLRQIMGKPELFKSLVGQVTLKRTYL